MFRTLIAALSLAAVAVTVAPAAHAENFAAPEYAAPESASAPSANAQDRLMIVSRNTGKVIYDDGRNDLFCVTQRYIAGYTEYGRPIVRRSMRCR
jgi:hypothetical protein